MKNRTLKKEGNKMKGEMKGLILACKYSWNCQNASVLKISDKLLDYALGKDKNHSEIKKILKKLGTYKFYLAISKINKKGAFDWRLISNYWKGAPIAKTDFWHNYTTLIPVIDIPTKFINMELINECLVHPTEITQIKTDALKVKYFPVTKKGKNLVLSNKPKEKKVKNLLKNKISKGDYATIHFSEIIETITKKDFCKLAEITCHSLEKFNKQHAKAE